MSAFTWTTPDRESPTLDYDTSAEIVSRYIGQRVRVSYPNGAQRVGVVGSRQIGVHTVLTFDGSTVMGELAGGVRVEVMGDNRRYSEVAL